MPKYHFDTDCGDLRYHDEDGIELDSIDQAQQQLTALLRDLSFHDPEASVTGVSAQVRCNGATVLQGSCSMTVSRPSVWSPIL
jgi:hypothetical protein